MREALRLKSVVLAYNPKQNLPALGEIDFVTIRVGYQWWIPSCRRLNGESLPVSCKSLGAIQTGMPLASHQSIVLRPAQTCFPGRNHFYLVGVVAAVVLTLPTPYYRIRLAVAESGLVPLRVALVFDLLCLCLPAL
jgi:hypothetical protein